MSFIISSPTCTHQGPISLGTLGFSDMAIVWA
eukprot:CAMPEP_0182515444 /NCGR_PEP_ID=MMETSP1321-20130603/38086_1 /TAXON_ID=91990 /ORGANISM="Bolidomonas sp., Strain RCC1657" /LENGTH=31 /DNA_ID= /DNA_START= /DNA_END= /DNA_ORIENTATION=